MVEAQTTESLHFHFGLLVDAFTTTKDAQQNVSHHDALLLLILCSFAQFNDSI